MKRTTFLLILTLLFLNLSCKKYLDEKSDATLLVPSTLGDLQSLMDDATTMNYTTPGFGASSSDDYFIDNNAYNTKNIFLQHVYKWLPYPYRFNNDWAVAYKAIYVSNLCLERIALVNRQASNAAEWDQVKGSALFYKAFYELELAWLFAAAYETGTAGSEPGIVLRTGTDFTVPSVRATMQETYEKITDQALEAAQLLQDEALIATRPSRCAAFALLARTYLSMRQYDSAAEYANRSLQIRSTLMNYNDATLVGISATNPFKLFNREVIFHATMGVTINLHSPTSGPARIDSLLYSAYDANDFRKRAFFTAVAGYYRFKGSYSGSTTRLFSGIATDEMYLVRAECFARAGDRLSALADLNVLLRNRFTTAGFVAVNAATASGALDTILAERRKELIYRGSLRWMDVKRLNREGRQIILSRKIDNQLFVLPPNDRRYALQIPEDIIELTGIQQN